MKDMKNRLMVFAISVLMVCLLPMVSEAQNWQTSTLQSPVGTYTPKVTPVGSIHAQSQASTTSDEIPPRLNSSRPRKSDFGPGKDGGYQDPNFPIGDAWPLAIFAALFAAYIAIRKYNINAKKGQQS